MRVGQEPVDGEWGFALGEPEQRARVRRGRGAVDGWRFGFVPCLVAGVEDLAAAGDGP
ncbi:hypothetical protein [Streptomyces sp. ISID311]|uniref:hypothetical protein n=1 Tax=Streptomyces sp. ISID311 TaxID=2601673 RepID=UPI00164A54DF|nr:hypothetical protein [Streptomyces sp. ISID311]